MAIASRLSSAQLWLGYKGWPAIQEINLEIKPGEMVSLIGPNGSGKSTLLRGLARLLPCLSGAVLLDGRAIHTFSGREVARRIGILPQGPESPFDLTVREVVALGRWPHRRGWLAFDGLHDAAVEWALAITALTPFAHRPLATVSGGRTSAGLDRHGSGTNAHHIVVG